MNYNQDIDNAANQLRKGEVILYPTDTVWGLGCDATNEEAVRKVYKLKERAESKSLITLCADIEQLKHYVTTIPALALDMIVEAVRPLTIIYPNPQGLAFNVYAEDGSTAIRIPKHQYCHDLIQALGKPIISSSANFSGRPTPMNFKQIDKYILRQVAYIAQFGQQETEKHKPSIVIRVGLCGGIEVIRK